MTRRADYADVWNGFRRPPAPSQPGPRPAAVATTPAAVQSPSDTDDAAAATDALRSRLHETLRHAVSELEAELTPWGWTTELATLLQDLVRDPAGQLRQLPAAAQRALRACNDENVATGALVALFEQDPMLTEAVLKRANSAYYNPGGPACLSLGPAIVRQGRRSVHNVILQQSLGGFVCRPGVAWNQMVADIWSHMVRTGPLARSLAPAFDADPEQAFTLGLLHDVGKLVLFDRIAARRTVKRAEVEIPAEAMTRTLQKLHEPLGAFCVLHWRLGDVAANTIATHHRDPLPATKDVSTEVIWLAEKVDLADARGRQIDLQTLFRDGALTGDFDAAAAAIASALEERKQTPPAN